MSIGPTTLQEALKMIERQFAQLDILSQRIGHLQLSLDYHRTVDAELWEKLHAESRTWPEPIQTKYWNLVANGTPDVMARIPPTTTANLRYKIQLLTDEVESKDRTIDQLKRELKKEYARRAPHEADQILEETMHRILGRPFA